MNLQSLKRHAGRSDIRVRLLAGYQGPFSIGVGQGSHDGELAFVLRVATADVGRFPTSIPVEGENVPVQVRPGYAEPRLQVATDEALPEG